MPYVSFTVPGIPVSKGRPKFARRGAFVHAYTPAKTESYEAQLKFFFLKSAGSLWQPLDCSIELTVNALFPMPKSAPKKDRERGIVPKLTKPDIDNVVKIVCDGLNGVAWIDDSRVWKISAEKKLVNTPPELFIRIDW
jgi:Holliday junction resolvase RusA-like endonuclease